MGLKILSEQIRNEILQLNLKTPPDVVSGLINLIKKRAKNFKSKSQQLSLFE
jgi:hypothetical protein